MAFEVLPDIQHPYSQYTLKDAVHLAVSNAQAFDHPVPATLPEVRDHIKAMAQRSGHNWITGAVALDVLDAAIDNRNLLEDCRIV